MLSLKALTELIDDFMTGTKIDDELVYKKCLKKYIVVMKKLHDTITNESRTNVNNSSTAKFRANKLEVVLIISTYDGSTQSSIVHQCDDQSLCYTVGQVVEPDSFDEDLDVVCSNGIHYFRSLEPAYYYHALLDSYDGPMKEWHEDGSIFRQSTYSKGKFHGLYEIWHENGQIHIRYNFEDGEINGLGETWYNNGKYYSKGSYVNGKKNGLWDYWYSNGRPCSRCSYVDNSKDGLYEGWYEFRSTSIKCNYVNDKLNGLCEKWHDNGRLSFRGTYEDGEVVGPHEEWKYNGEKRRDWRKKIDK